LGPEVLTSAMKRVDTSVYDTIKRVLAGTFAGGTNTVFDLRNNGVGLGKVSPKVPPADVAKVKKIAKQIAAGGIKNIPTELTPSYRVRVQARRGTGRWHMREGLVLPKPGSERYADPVS